jgi:hypothetical protein
LITAYIHFGAAQRAMVEATNPDTSYGEAAKCIGQLWLAASVAELQPFLDAVLADKARHKREEAMEFAAKLSTNAVRVRLEPLVLGASDRTLTHTSWKELYRDFSVWTAAFIREDASYDMTRTALTPPTKATAVVIIMMIYQTICGLKFIEFDMSEYMDVERSERS